MLSKNIAIWCFLFFSFLWTVNAQTLSAPWIELDIPEASWEKQDTSDFPLVKEGSWFGLNYFSSFLSDSEEIIAVQIFRFSWKWNETRFMSNMIKKRRGNTILTNIKKELLQNDMHISWPVFFDTGSIGNYGLITYKFNDLQMWGSLCIYPSAPKSRDLFMIQILSYEKSVIEAKNICRSMKYMTE